MDAGAQPDADRNGGRSGVKAVPQSRGRRERIRDACERWTADVDKSRPLSRKELEAAAGRILAELEFDPSMLGWTMVMIANAFWRDQVAAIPTSRRMLLLPHCLKHPDRCPASFDRAVLNCHACGTCSIGDFRVLAEQMGYRVLVAEGSPLVMKVIVSGQVDAIVGVACLNVLEKAFEKILLAGIPCVAVPLLSDRCSDSEVDGDWVEEMIRLSGTGTGRRTRTYVHLMRAARSMFDRRQLAELIARPGGVDGSTGDGEAGSFDRSADPIAVTESLARDFLARGGKYWRPFITLAVYDALTGGHATTAAGRQHVEALPTSVRRAAMSIEVFHKASLVHDDIEDDDIYRYGQATLHRQFGTPTAINVGDFLIGLGYRLVSGEVPQLGAEAVVEILDRLADAHTRLSRGQGAELWWRDSGNRRIAPLDALKIYALKTAPAFEAALFVGARLAGPADALVEPIRRLAKNLGVAYQILNDLDDWEGDDRNKLSVGGDVLGRRPTVLWALALEGLSEDDRIRLERTAQDAAEPVDRRIARVGELYQKAGVFAKARRLVDKYRDRAQQVADAVEPEELRRVFDFLVETVLHRGAKGCPEPVALDLLDADD